MAISHATRLAPSIQPSLPLLPFCILSCHLISSTRSGLIPQVQQGRHKRRRRAAICRTLRRLCDSIIKTHVAFIHTNRREALDKEIPSRPPATPLKQKECQALKLATKSPKAPPSERDAPRPGAPAFPCLIQSKVLPSLAPSPARKLSARAHVQRRDPMALNRKICKNLAQHSCGVGNAIRRRVRHQHRGGVSSADPRTCELRTRLSLVIGRLSFVIGRTISNAMANSWRPMTNDG